MRKCTKRSTAVCDSFLSAEQTTCQQDNIKMKENITSNFFANPTITFQQAMMPDERLSPISRKQSYAFIDTDKQTNQLLSPIWNDWREKHRRKTQIPRCGLSRNILTASLDVPGTKTNSRNAEDKLSVHHQARRRGISVKADMPPLSLNTFRF